MRGLKPRLWGRFPYTIFLHDAPETPAGQQFGVFWEPPLAIAGIAFVSLFLIGYHKSIEMSNFSEL